ncbi:MAG: hypothetical protein AB7K68_08070 [Bacteriovoracia bacterium]
MKPINAVILSAIFSFGFLAAQSAKAEMSQGAVETAKACAYMGAIGGAGAHVILERSALKYAAVGCAGAAAAVGGYNYLAIPIEADTPKESELQEEPENQEPASE